MTDIVFRNKAKLEFKNWTLTIMRPTASQALIQLLGSVGFRHHSKPCKGIIATKMASATTIMSKSTGNMLSVRHYSNVMKAESVELLAALAGTSDLSTATDVS